jgi:hypothetical protein
MQRFVVLKLSSESPDEVVLSHWPRELQECIETVAYGDAITAGIYDGGNGVQVSVCMQQS